jgi:hypothetical protein
MALDPDGERVCFDLVPLSSSFNAISDMLRPTVTMSDIGGGG